MTHRNTATYAAFTVHPRYAIHFSILWMDYTTPSSPLKLTQGMDRRFKRRKRPLVLHSAPYEDVQPVVLQPRPTPVVPKRLCLRYDAFHPPTVRVPFRMLNFFDGHSPEEIQKLIPGIKVCTLRVMNPDLCRRNFEIIMERMYYRKPSEQMKVEFQFIKKQQSCYNSYCLRYGHVVNPIYDVPDTLTVWVKLEKKVFRVPLDHFHILHFSRN